jgi:hypothetical protein
MTFSHSDLVCLRGMTDQQITDAYDELMIKLAGKVMDQTMTRILYEKFIIVLSDLEKLNYMGSGGWKNYFNIE